MKKFLLVALFGHFVLFSNGQVVDSYEVILTNEQHFKWLAGLSQKKKEEQLPLIEIRIVTDTLFKPGTDVPVVISGQHQQACKLAMTVAGHLFDFNGHINARTTGRLLNIIKPQNVETIEVVKDPPEGAGTGGRWCGMIVITLDKKASKKIKRIAKGIAAK